MDEILWYLQQPDGGIYTHYDHELRSGEYYPDVLTNVETTALVLIAYIDAFLEPFNTANDKTVIDLTRLEPTNLIIVGMLVVLGI